MRISFEVRHLPPAKPSVRVGLRDMCMCVWVWWRIFKAPFIWQESHTDGALREQKTCDPCLMEQKDISQSCFWADPTETTHPHHPRPKGPPLCLPITQHGRQTWRSSLQNHIQRNVVQVNKPFHSVLKVLKESESERLRFADNWLTWIYFNQSLDQSNDGPKCTNSLVPASQISAAFLSFFALQ